MVASAGSRYPTFAPPATSARVAALALALDALLEATDDVALAVQRHDRPALESANARAEGFVGTVTAATQALLEDDRFELTSSRVPALCEKLKAAARRNAYLIESAWAFDAAEMRLLAGLGRIAATGDLKEYGSPSGPAYVDRGA